LGARALRFVGMLPRFLYASYMPDWQQTICMRSQEFDV